MLNIIFLSRGEEHDHRVLGSSQLRKPYIPPECGTENYVIAHIRVQARSRVLPLTFHRSLRADVWQASASERWRMGGEAWVGGEGIVLAWVTWPCLHPCPHGSGGTQPPGEGEERRRGLPPRATGGPDKLTSYSAGHDEDWLMVWQGLHAHDRGPRAMRHGREERGGDRAGGRKDGPRLTTYCQAGTKSTDCCWLATLADQRRR